MARPPCTNYQRTRTKTAENITQAFKTRFSFSSFNTPIQSYFHRLSESTEDSRRLG